MESVEDRTARQIGLYYPYIHFQDEEWLRLAVLYWDRMARIVPQGFVPSDSPVVRDLQDEFDFVRNVEPSESQLLAVASHFQNLVRQSGDELRQRYSVGSNHHKTLKGLRPVIVLSPKMSRALQETLVEARLAQIGRARGIQAIYMHPKMADVYIGALAEEMAPELGCQPVTDDESSHVATAGLTVERLGRVLLDLRAVPITSAEVRAGMAYVACRSVLPRGLSNVPMKRLIAFRRDHREELTAFQRFVDRLARADGPLADRVGTADRSSLQMHLEVEYERTVQPELDRLRSAFWGIGVETIDSAVSVALKETAQGGVLASAMATNPGFVGGMVGLLTLRVLRDKRRAAQEAAKSPAAYLMHAREELSPGSLLDRLTVRVRRIALGT